MGFKTMKSYNDERFGGLFLLRNDGDYADVIFMYRSMDDVLIADTHYIKSADYSGYVHCCNRGCPACGKDIRVQTKLFIPLYNISAPDGGELQFWDRSARFDTQLTQAVFAKCANPSEYVFRITRHGAANDINTTYEIVVVGKNSFKSYDEILADNGVTFPEYYENVCKDFSSSALYNMLNTSSKSASSSISDVPNYSVTPRVATNVSAPVDLNTVAGISDSSTVDVDSTEFDSDDGLSEDPIF